MSKYTTELRWICEQFAHEAGVPDCAPVGDIVVAAAGRIFDPIKIGGEEHTNVLLYKILRHYYTREIAFETYGLWRLHLNNKMAEIAPLYNEMYSSYDEYLGMKKYNNNDMTTTRHHGESETTSGTNNTQTNTNATSESVSDNSTQSVDRFSNTPQGGLDGVRNDKYLTTARITDDTNATKTTDESESGTHSEQTTAGSATRQRDEREQHLGRSGVLPSAVYKEILANIQNIDMLVINELEPLFMQIW